MTITDLNVVVRAIVREELKRLVPAALLRPPPPEGDPVAAFLRALAPGSEVGAAELYRRFCEAQGAAERRRSIQWFGRRVRASGLVRAEHRRQGEVYVVVGPRELAEGAGAAGGEEVGGG